jgi:hypothetical protein
MLVGTYVFSAGAGNLRMLTAATVLNFLMVLFVSRGVFQKHNPMVEKRLLLSLFSFISFLDIFCHFSLFLS